MLLIALSAIFALGFFGTMIAQTIARAKYGTGNSGKVKNRSEVVYVDQDGREIQTPIRNVKQDKGNLSTPITVESVKVPPVFGDEVKAAQSVESRIPTPSMPDPIIVSDEVLQTPAILRQPKAQSLQSLRREMGFKSALEEHLEQEAIRNRRNEKRRAARAAKKKPKTEVTTRPLTLEEEAEHSARLQEQQLRELDKGPQPPLP